MSIRKNSKTLIICASRFVSLCVLVVKKLFHTVLVAVFAIPLCLSAAQAEGFDPCPRLHGAEDNEPRIRWNWFLTGNDEAEPVPYSEHEYYVTVTPGRFVNVRCDDAQFEEQEMYPIGVVVKPIAYVSLPDFEAGRGDRAILVITEYGHRKLIREQDIQPLLQEQTYFFSDSPANSLICRSAENCPGSGMDICDRPSQCRYVVSARYGFAVAEADDPQAMSTIQAFQAALSQSSRDADFWSESGDEISLEDLEEAACQPFPVLAYKAGGEPHQSGASYLSFCASRKAAGAEYNALFPLKIVTKSYADQAFAWQLDGSFHRRFGVGQAGQDTNLLDAMTNYRITSVKECGTEISDTSGFDASVGLKAKVSAGIFEASAGAETALTAEITNTLSEDDYLLMSTYFIEPIKNAPAVSEEDDSELWLFRVIFRSRCVDGTPKSATSVIIHYHRLSSKVLEVRAADDLKQSYLQKWKDYAYAANTSASALREGQFWTVPDLAGYFIWRDTLRKFIEVENNVTSRLLARHPQEQRPYVRDFFVFLMLAAAFDHRDPSLN